MKKLLLLFAALLAIVCLCSCHNAPKETPATDFEYKLSDDGQSVYITKYIGTSQNVVVPAEIDGKKVFSILFTGSGIPGSGAFEGSNVRSVTLPDTVLGIGRYAFRDCKELTEIKVSKNLRGIGGRAFQGCINLKTVDFSKTALKDMDGGVFEDCTGLEHIALPETLVEIGAIAFRNCSSLLEIDLPNGLQKIGRAAFSYCSSLKTIRVPTSLDLKFMSSESVFYEMPVLEKIIFKDGWENLDGFYGYFSISSNPQIIIPKSTKRFSTLPFMIMGGCSARFVFEGDCPEIIEPTSFYSAPTIYYHPETKGWDDCAWVGVYEMIPIK